MSIIALLMWAGAGIAIGVTALGAVALFGSAIIYGLIYEFIGR